MPREKIQWSDRVVLWALILFVAVFWTAAAYGVSHWLGAPFSPLALTAVFIVTGLLALFLFALLRQTRD